MNLAIRGATPDDAARIAEIHARTWQSAYRGLLPDDALDAMTPDQRLPMWSRILSGPESPVRVFVAERDDSIVGFVSIGGARDSTHPGDTSELYAIYVDPQAQGRGAGTGLLHAAETAMRGAGSASAMLWVLDGNERALRFYRQHGWEADGAIRDDVLFDVPVREVRFRKRLRNLTGESELEPA